MKFHKTIEIHIILIKNVFLLLLKSKIKPSGELNYYKNISTFENNYKIYILFIHIK